VRDLLEFLLDFRFLSAVEGRGDLGCKSCIGRQAQTSLKTLTSGQPWFLSWKVDKKLVTGWNTVPANPQGQLQKSGL
jgi:hypothetical protein